MLELRDLPEVLLFVGEEGLHRSRCLWIAIDDRKRLEGGGIGRRSEVGIIDTKRNIGGEISYRMRKRERAMEVFVSVSRIFIHDRISGFSLTQSDMRTELVEF